MTIGASGRLPLGLQWILATVISLFLGVVAATSNIWLLFVGAVPVVAWLSYRYPPVTVIAFWLLYLLQTTVFAGSVSVQGLYYPLYLLMAANLVAYLTAAREAITIPRSLLVIYAAFYGVVCVSLLWQPPGVFVNTPQRLFIYSLGLLAVAQIRTPQHVKAVYIAFMVSALMVSSWTVLEARASFFGYRGGGVVNQNYLATLIAFGMIPLFAALVDKHQRWHPFVQVALGACLFGGTYATLLLASRGVTAAVVVAAVVMLFRNGVRTPGRMLLVLLASGLCIYLLVQLPGADNLVQRLTEANTESFNDRLPLWVSSLHAFAVAPVYAQLLGHGMGASEILVHSIHPLLTSLHNGYLQILFDFGLLGASLFVGLVLTAFHRAWKSADYIGSAGTGMIAFMLVALLSATLQDGFLFWIGLGITFAHTKHVAELKHAT